MSPAGARNLESKVFAKQPQAFPRNSVTSVILSERNLLDRASECRVLIKSFSKEDIKGILQRNIGSRNMSKLFAMIEFLEIKSGRKASDEFIKNIILLLFLYGSRRGKRELAFIDLVFQALYETLSKGENES